MQPQHGKIFIPTRRSEMESAQSVPLNLTDDPSADRGHQLAVMMRPGSSDGNHWEVMPVNG
jgi:hypothetical protein